MTRCMSVSVTKEVKLGQWDLDLRLPFGPVTKIPCIPVTIGFKGCIGMVSHHPIEIQLSTK